ncbi:hypothetical protein FGB62_171g013 [Gracilaria domingensis]|nr:hypothetical protein FGB62_171g013 [Gracilaria domingensis]
MGALMDDTVHVEVEVIENVVLIETLQYQGIAVREEAEHLRNAHFCICAAWGRRCGMKKSDGELAGATSAVKSGGRADGKGGKNTRLLSSVPSLLAAAPRWRPQEWRIARRGDPATKIG